MIEGTASNEAEGGLGAHDLLQQGIAAAKEGRREDARELLMGVVGQDEDNALAWLWLSDVVDRLEDREICLENVLTLDPDHARARSGLAQIHRERDNQSPRPTEAMPSGSRTAESPVVTRARAPVSPAAAILRAGRGATAAPPESLPPAEGIPALETYRERIQETKSVPAIPQETHFNELLCPYCMAQTQPEDKTCGPGGHDLWMRSRRREERSALLWIMLASQFFSTFSLSLGPLVAVLYAGLSTVGLPELPSVADPLAIAYAAANFPDPSEIVNAGLRAVPAYAWALSFLPCLFAAGVFVATFLRWKPVFYLLLADAVWWLIAAIASMVLAQAIIAGLVGVVLAVGKVLIVFQLEDDFAWDKRRHLFRFDPGLSAGTDFLARGNDYAQRGVWGLAALHLRRAIVSLPYRLDARMALAVAHIRLGQYRQAERVLAEAQQRSPGDPRITELEGLLDDLRSGAASL